MKALITIATLLFFSSIQLNGQILEKEANMSLGIQTASQVQLDDVDTKDALKLWKEYFKEYGKLKRNKKADEYYSTGVKINRIYDISKIDVYTRFEERGKSTVLTIWVDLGMAFVNSKDYPSEYKGLVVILDEFRVLAREFVVENEMKAAENQLVKFENDLEKLEKDKIKLHEKIADYNEKIIKAEEDIDDNKDEQLQSKMNIDRQIEVLKEIQIRLVSIRNQKL